MTSEQIYTTDADEGTTSSAETTTPGAPVLGSGIGYRTEGETGADYNVYGFGAEGMSFLFDGVPDSFNCFSMTYSSSVPLECTADYTENGARISDVFYLEAGDNKSFSSLTEGYVAGLTASGFSSIKLRPLKGKSGKFSLSDLALSVREKAPDGELFISNGKIKLGIRLEWGGGISYYEDLNDGDDTLGNLLNSHDTGRLVQQSYYGSSSAPYIPGLYNGQTWSYNPVQGGNLYGEKSRLIDFGVSDDGLSVYIKSLPRDWAKKGIYSISYTENAYTVCDGYVSVSNRFVDFSGYTHPAAHQELPAFYTVSYLSDFCYYNGTSPWKNGELTIKKDLPFWGGNSEAYLTPKTKENWCAWLSPEGFGIGVYTPIASILLAGRYNYDGSKSAEADATNYVAPLITKKLESFVPFEYSYYISSGTVESIRDCFKAISGH